MTTQVPDGTSEAEVERMRTREAARACELAAQGHLLRLWRPPLNPGEWRTLGLFAADDPTRLEEILASMPLRAWRTDEVTALSPHPNDPPPSLVPEGGEGGSGGEFLTSFQLVIPPDTPRQTADTAIAAEADRTRELAAQGNLRRLWTLPPAQPGQSRALGLWRAERADAMREILRSLPLRAWLSVQTTPLDPHPNDPRRARSA